MNSAFVGIVFYIIYNFITTIQSDVSIRAENALVQEREKRDKCEQDYLTELCYKPHGPSHKPLCDHLFACKNNPLPRIERYGVHHIFFCWLRKEAIFWCTLR